VSWLHDSFGPLLLSITVVGMLNFHHRFALLNVDPPVLLWFAPVNPIGAGRGPLPIEDLGKAGHAVPWRTLLRCATVATRGI
jgi:hypothetical protein